MLGPPDYANKPKALMARPGSTWSRLGPWLHGSVAGPGEPVPSLGLVEAPTWPAGPALTPQPSQPRILAHIRSEEQLRDALWSFPEVETEPITCLLGSSFHCPARCAGPGWILSKWILAGVLDKSYISPTEFIAPFFLIILDVLPIIPLAFSEDRDK